MSLKVRVATSLVILFAALTYIFAWSSLFSVRTISTVGAPKEISADALIAKSEISIGEKLSRIEPRSIERSLRELSWISKASVDRNWLKGAVTIEVVPRIPVGIYMGRAIDKSGTLFVLPGNKPVGLPVVSAASPELGLRQSPSLPTFRRRSALRQSLSAPQILISFHRGKNKVIES
jgi:cell division septal protein FtsQ